MNEQYLNLRFLINDLFRPLLREVVQDELRNLEFNQSRILMPEPEQHFDLPALCQYLPDKPNIETAREWARVGQIPCHKKGKKYYFLKSEIDNYLKTGRKKTQSEQMDELRIDAEKQLELMRNKAKK
jgi:hypothetical protein